MTLFLTALFAGLRDRAARMRFPARPGPAEAACGGTTPGRCMCLLLTLRCLVLTLYDLPAAGRWVGLAGCMIVL
jgi:hypothetical protein